MEPIPKWVQPSLIKAQPSPTDIVIQTLQGSRKWTGLVEAIKAINRKNPYKTQKYEEGGITTDEAQQMWVEQCTFNFPLLYLASIYLYLYMKEQGCEVLLFATRDCCHWYRIFHRMFPEIKAYYFHCSRNMFSLACRGHNPSFNDYVRSLVLGKDKDPDLMPEALTRAIYIDAHGTGQHPLNFFRKNYGEVPHIFLLSTSRESYNRMPSVCRKYLKEDPKIHSLIFGFNGGPIEMLNYDLRGTLQNFSPEGKPIRDPLEYDRALVVPYHECITFTIEHMVPLPNKDIGSRYSQEELLPLITKIFDLIHNSPTIIRRHVHHIGRHKKTVAIKKARK